MGFKNILAVAALGCFAMAPVSAGAAASLTVGDHLTLVYQYPSVGADFQTTNFTYTGAGQIVPTQYGESLLDIVSNNSIEFKFLAAAGCGFLCFEVPAAWNGPLLIDNSNSNAFANWSVTQDTVGITSAVIQPGEVGVNWQGANAAGQVVFSSVPEPSTWAMMLAGFAVMGYVGYRRRNSAVSVNLA